MLVTLVALTAIPAALAQDLPPPAEQTPPAPPPIEQAATWSGTVGGGLSLTSGNTDSLTYNLAFDIARNSQQGNVVKWTGLYLRGAQNKIVVVNRLSLGVRDEFRF